VLSDESRRKKYDEYLSYLQRRSQRQGRERQKGSGRASGGSSGRGRFEDPMDDLADMYEYVFETMRFVSSTPIPRGWPPQQALLLQRNPMDIFAEMFGSTSGRGPAKVQDIRELYVADAVGMRERVAWSRTARGETIATIIRTYRFADGVEESVAQDFTVDYGQEVPLTDIYAYVEEGGEPRDGLAVLEELAVRIRQVPGMLWKNVFSKLWKKIVCFVTEGEAEGCSRRRNTGPRWWRKTRYGLASRGDAEESPLATAGLSAMRSSLCITGKCVGGYERFLVGSSRESSCRLL